MQFILCLFCCINVRKNREIQLKKAIASELRSVLKEKGWSQKEFAAKLKKDAGYVSHILRAEQNLTIESIAKIELLIGRELVRVGAV